jgi:hypothetical protein
MFPRGLATGRTVPRPQSLPPLLNERWLKTVGRPEFQKFTGALHGQHATKGIFITTSDFSRDANDYVSKIGSKIVLIDGSRLAELMIEFGVAVATDATYTFRPSGSMKRGIRAGTHLQSEGPGRVNYFKFTGCL